MREAVIVEAVRTPVGKRNGGLSDHARGRPVGRGAQRARRADRYRPGRGGRRGLGLRVPGRRPGEQHRPLLGAGRGLAGDIPGTTINRACGSSQQALDFAVQAVVSGQQDLVVAGGVEVMSRVPLGAAKAGGEPYGPRACGLAIRTFRSTRGISAELIAQKWGLERGRLDAFAALSHERAALAQDTGAFDDQIVPVVVGDDGVPVTHDEGIRRGTTVESLAGSSPLSPRTASSTRATPRRSLTAPPPCSSRRLRRHANWA
jgi:acetyl-CoA acyltransferase